MNQEYDEAVLTEVGNALSGATFGVGIDDIVGRGRVIRRRHRTLMAGLGTSAAALVAVVAVAVPSGTSGAAATALGGHATAASPGGAGTGAANPATGVQKAAYDISSDALKGTVTVTLHSVLDPAKLRADLAAAGVTADVVVSGDGTPVKNLPALCGPEVKPDPKNFDMWEAFGIRTLSGADLPAGDEFAFEVTPAKLPTSSTLAIVIHYKGAGVDLVSTGLFAGAPTVCAVPPTKSVPTGAHA